MRTLIQGGYIVGYYNGEHRLLRDGVVVFQDNTVVHVGRSYPYPVDRVINARGRKLVCPGFINAHLHASSQAGEKVTADAGRPELLNCGFLNYLPARGREGSFSLLDLERPEIGGLYSLYMCLRTGSTTIVEMGGELGGKGNIERFAQLCGEMGIRAYLSPGYGAGHWYYNADDRLHLYWDEEGALRDLERAKEFIRNYHGAFSGRIQGMLFPVEVATSTPRLLQATREAAEELGVGISIHCAETLVEFFHIVRTYGKTPVGYLWENGFLGPRVLLGHCVFTTAHSAVTYSGANDLQMVASSGASVAHCPLVFARRGFALESFQRYLQAGINLALGTDTYPQDIIQEMRLASLMCKVVERDYTAGSARDVFNAATLGGARALGRDDLGRLAPGARADIVIVNLEHPRFGGVLDPIKALVQCGTGDDVETVIVDGRTVVEGGRVIGVEEGEMLARLQEASERVWASFPRYDWRGRTVEDLSPPALETVEDLPYTPPPP